MTYDTRFKMQRYAAPKLHASFPLTLHVCSISISSVSAAPQIYIADTFDQDVPGNTPQLEDLVDRKLLCRSVSFPFSAPRAQLHLMLTA